MTLSGEDPPLRLLALDGGGIRGLSELLIIKGVMHRLMVEENTKRKRDGRPPLSILPKPCDYFDLIGGTNTGGIIALMLGRLRMDVDTAIKRYDELADHVFSDPKKWGDGKFKVTKLEEAVKSVVEDITGDSESPLLESDEDGVCKTFVCSMNAHDMSANIPVLFRTYQSREVHSKCKIWEAARATSALPTFFKRVEIGRQPFIDGGLGRNNPSCLVLDEAKRLFSSRQIGLLLSIGTGMAKIISIKKPGIFQRIVPTDVIVALKAIATDCESTHEAMVDLFANSPNTYFRMNVDQGMQEIKLSEWEKLSIVEAHTAQYMKRKEVDAKLGLLVDMTRSPRGHLTMEQLLSPRPLVESSSIQHVEGRRLSPLPVVSFTGRREILDKMHRYFDSDSSSQRVFVLYGLGGSGKSQLAFKFLQESQVNKRFSDIFYVDATSEQTLGMDLQAIAPGNAERSVDVSLVWLANQRDRRWLLFFDNADAVHLTLKKFFPSCTSGNILVTTRNQELRHYATKGSDHHVTDMGHEDATNLLMDLSHAEETDENKTLAAQIVKELHHFALAISQAGAFIRCHSSLSDYRVLYQRERDNLLQNEEVQNPDPYGKAVYATWRLSYDKLDDASRSFLQICSLLHHEGIAEEMFEKAALSPLQLEDPEIQNEVAKMLDHLGKQDSGWSSWVFRRVVKHLGLHSLIEYDRRNGTYSVHPLVQHWSGTTIGDNGHVMRKCVVTIIGLSMLLNDSEEDYKYRRSLLKHITNCTTSLTPTEIDLSVAPHLAVTYSEQGCWRDAKVLQVVVMEKSKRLLGDDHPDTLMSMAHLACTYRNLGLLKDSEVLHLATIEKRKRILGDDHPETLRSMANLAVTYVNQDRCKDAEVLEVVVIEKRKQLLGDEHPDTLISMANLANTYMNQGHWKEAETLGEAVMEKRKRLLGDDHLDTLMSIANLGATYWHQGRWKDAEKLGLLAMEKRKLLLGDDHPDTLTSMANCAAAYREQERWRDAEVLEMVVMEKRKRLLGDDHPDTLLTMENLATGYGHQGRWKDAEILHMAVTEKMRRRLGDDHPDTLVSMDRLAITYSRQCRWTDAEMLFVVVMEKSKRLLGDEHPHTLMRTTALATVYGIQGRWKDAELLHVAVMEKKKLLLGDGHPETLESMAKLAFTYKKQERWKDAETLEVVVMENRKLLLGNDHPDTLTSIANLADTYENQSRWKDLEVLQLVVMEVAKRLLGDNHPVTLVNMEDLAVTYRRQGCLKEAEVLEAKVAAGRRSQPNTLFPHHCKCA